MNKIIITTVMYIKRRMVSYLVGLQDWIG